MRRNASGKLSKRIQGIIGDNRAILEEAIGQLKEDVNLLEVERLKPLLKQLGDAVEGGQLLWEKGQETVKVAVVEHVIDNYTIAGELKGHGTIKVKVSLNTYRGNDPTNWDMVVVEETVGGRSYKSEFENRGQYNMPDQGGDEIVQLTKYPGARSEVRSGEEDQRIAQSIVWFFLRKGVNFKSDLEDVYQEIYLAFFEERRKRETKLVPEPSEQELWRVGSAAVGKMAYGHKKAASVLSKLFEEAQGKPESKESTEEEELSNRAVSLLGVDAFSKRVKSAMKMENWDNPGLARALNVTLSTVSSWRSGRYLRRLPHPENVKNLANKLKMTVSELISGMTRKELLGIRIEDEKSQDYREILGLKIKVLRYEIGWIQEKFAEEVGVTGAVVSNWEDGQYPPDARHIGLVAMKLGTSISLLIAGMSEKKLNGKAIINERNSQDLKLLGLKLRVLRYEKGLLQSELAAIAEDVSRKTITGLEAGNSLPPPHKIMKLMAKLYFGISKFLSGKSYEDLMRTAAVNLTRLKDRKLLGLKIKVLRYKKEWTIKEFSSRIKYTGVISAVEAGRVKLEGPHIKAMADQLGTTVSELIAGMPLKELMFQPNEDFKDLQMRKVIGLKIRILRITRGWTIEKLAAEMGAHRDNVARWEAGESLPDLYRVETLANKLKTTVWALIAGRTEKELAERLKTSQVGNFQKLFNILLRVLKYEKGWTNHELGHAIGVPGPSIAGWLAREDIPGIDNWNKMVSGEGRKILGKFLPSTPPRSELREAEPQVIGRDLRDNSYDNSDRHPRTNGYEPLPGLRQKRFQPNASQISRDNTVVLFDGSRPASRDLAAELVVQVKKGYTVVVYNEDATSGMVQLLKSFRLPMSKMRFVQGPLAEAAAPYYKRKIMNVVLYSGKDQTGEDEAKLVEQLNGRAIRIWGDTETGALGVGLKHLGALLLNKPVKDVIRVEESQFRVTRKATDPMNALNKAQFAVIFAQAA